MSATEVVEMAKGVVMWGEDEDAFVYRLDGGDEELAEHRFVVEAPAELWDAADRALRAYRRAVDGILEASRIDTEMMRLAECCPAWTGYVTPPHHRFTVRLTGSGNAEEWPVHDHNVDLSFHETETEAQARIDGLPTEFYIHYGAWPLAKVVRRERLSIGESGWRGSTSSCYRCGWDRGDHADQGQEIETVNARALRRLAESTGGEPSGADHG